MLFDLLFELTSHFTLPHFPVLDSDVVSVRARIRIPVSLFTPSLLTHFGLPGLSLAGLWAVARLYSAESAEPVLMPQNTGKVRDPISPDLATGISAASIVHDEASPVIEDETIRPPSAQPPADLKPVDVSAFAPPAVSPGDEFYIQIMLHSRDQLEQAKELAKQLGESAGLSKSIPLRLPLKEDDEIRVTIDGRGAAIADPEQTFVWRGYFAHLAFAVRLPGNMGERQYKPLVRIFVNKAPAGIMEIALRTVCNAVDQGALPVSQKALRFSKVFMSYASEDRAKVLDMAKMLRAQRIDFFQDLLSLEPGERWERQIYNEIANCDAFYLFWSSNAKRSEWVVKEAVLALKHQKNSTGETPYFLPIIIEGPPIVEPPPELSEIHFNDPLQHIIFAEEILRKNQQERKTPA